MNTTVVIPVYGRWDLAGLAVRSIRDTCDAAVVVVDDCGPGHCPSDLFASIDVLHRHSTNLGFAASCNSGLELADNPDVVVFFNSDAVARPGWLAPLADALAEPDVAVAGPTILRPGGDLQTTGIRIDWSANPGRWAREIVDPVHTRDVDAVTGACMAVRPDVWADLDLFDAEYRNGFEDVDACLAVTAAGWRIRFVAESVVDHYGNGSKRHLNMTSAANIGRLLVKWSPHHR